MFRSRSAALLTYLLVRAFTSDLSFGQQLSRAEPPESYLRVHVLRQLVPNYPEDALLQHKEGVAVAQLAIDQLGRVERVTVLEAPSSSIAESLTKTLVQWQFEPVVVRGQTFAAVGKLTFYFVIRKGGGVVLSPKEAPYLGRWPEKTDGASRQGRNI